jgi:hypothetical protein
MLLKDRQDRYAKATRLLDFLLKQAEEGRRGNPGEPDPATRAADYARKLLEEWEPADEADALFLRLLRAYDVMDLGPAEFADREEAALAKVRKRYEKRVAELNLLFLGDLARGRPLPLFQQDAEVARLFPSWAGAWKKSPDARATFSRVLKQAADVYYQRSLPCAPGGPGGPAPKYNVDDAARQALTRYTAAYALDPRNAVAAVYALSTLLQHRGALDKGPLLEQLREALVGQKGGLKEQVKMHDDPDLWRALFRCHAILADVAAEQKRWGPETDRTSVLYYLAEARADENHIREKFDQDAAPAAWIDEHLGRAWSQPGNRNDDKAVEYYRRAAEGFVRARSPTEAKAALDAAKKIMREVNADWGSGLQSDLKRLGALYESADRVVELSSRSLERGAVTVSFLPGGKRLLWGDGKVAFLGSVGGEDPPRPLTKKDVTLPVVAPDGKSFAAARGALAVLCDLADGGKEKELPGGRESTITALAFAPDGKTLAAADQDGGAVIWNLPQGTKRFALAPAGKDPAQAVAFSRSGKLLAVAAGKSVVIWDAKTGKRTGQVLEGQDGPVLALSWVEGNVLATGGADKAVRLWQADTGKQLAALRARPAAVTALAFSPDAKLLAAGGADGVTVLWDVTRPGTSKEVAWLTPGRGRVASVGFAPDGKGVALGLASADKRGEVKIWDVSKLIKP